MLKSFIKLDFSIHGIAMIAIIVLGTVIFFAAIGKAWNYYETYKAERKKKTEKT